jgi:hypothetical protein
LLDPNISTVGGDTSVFVLRSDDLMYWTTGVQARAFPHA